MSFEEQEALSEAINCLPERFLPGVVEVLQKAGAAGQDDMDLDLDIDELETKTQRELQRFVMEVSYEVPKTEQHYLTSDDLSLTFILLNLYPIKVKATGVRPKSLGCLRVC